MTATTINEKVYQIRKGVLDHMNIQGGRQQHRLATLESDSGKLSNYEARLQGITAELEPSVATIKHSEEQQQILSSQIQQSVLAIQELLAKCAGNHGGVRDDPDFQTIGTIMEEVQSIAAGTVRLQKRFAIVSGVTATTQHQVSKLQAEEAQLTGHVTKLE